MPILDVMPVSTWRDVRSVLVSARTPDDDEIAEMLLHGRNFKSAQSFTHLRGAVEFLFNKGSFPNKRVVFPRYICGSVVRAAERAGMRVTFCDIDKKTGALSAEALAQIPLEKFGAVFVVHPFGVPSDIAKIAEICRKKKVFLVEDCAHVWDLILDGKPVGHFGDFVLFHFAKKVANVHGSLLISFKTKLPYANLKKARVSFSELFSLIIKMRLFRRPLNLLRSITKVPIDHDAQQDKVFSKQVAASSASKRLFLKKLKVFRKNKSKRSEILKVYLEHVPKNYKCLLKSLPGDSFHFPILTPKDKNRNEILKKMRVYGIFADRPWYTADIDFASRLILLPVNADMTTKDAFMICKLLEQA